MTSVVDGRRRFEYHSWATRRLTDALQREGPACAALAHACTADSVWLSRLRGESTSGVELWPALAPPAVRTLASAIETAWSHYFRDLEDAGLIRIVSYTNSRGDSFDTSAGDILDHVLLHGAYHRGQAAAALRSAGVPPPATDFIVWVRTL